MLRYNFASVNVVGETAAVLYAILITQLVKDVIKLERMQKRYQDVIG